MCLDLEIGRDFRKKSALSVAYWELFCRRVLQRGKKETAASCVLWGLALGMHHGDSPEKPHQCSGNSCLQQAPALGLCFKVASGQFWLPWRMGKNLFWGESWGNGCGFTTPVKAWVEQGGNTKAVHGCEKLKQWCSSLMFFAFAFCFLSFLPTTIWLITKIYFTFLSQITSRHMALMRAREGLFF